MIEIIKNLCSGMAAHPAITKKALRIKKEVYKKIAPLSVYAVPSDEPIAKSDLACYEEKPVNRGFKWAEQKFGACWFRIKGQVPPEYVGRHIVVVMNIGGEGLAYDGDDTVDIITPILSVSDVMQPPTAGKRIIECRQGEEKIDMLIDCGYNGYNGKFINSARLDYAYIAEKRDDICRYYYDYVTLALLLATADKNERITPALKKELVGILTDSYDKYNRGDMAGAEKVLHSYYDRRQDYDCPTYAMIGHAHLDLAWLWPERESKRKAVRTFTNAVSMIEKHPDYVFGASQAQMFAWVQQSHPALFEKIKRYVKSGNIELQGGMWVESDCNMPSGESLIRQFFYGDKFFIDNFGKTSDTVWLPDAFGYPITLPQIIKGVGKNNFATIKLNWNKNKLPYQTFWWVAPDGSRVLAHISPEGTYCNDGTPLAIEKSERKNRQKEIGSALIIYGVGDGGGGPGEGHIEIAERSRALYGTARTRMVGTDRFFDELEQTEGIPEYAEELYLEKHQGTLTSQSENKRLNRLAETELHLTEWLAAVAGEEVGLDEEWKRLLFSQFHDVLPGSGIGRVHRESQEDLAKVIKSIVARRENLLDVLKTGEGLSALNPSPFYRREYADIDGKSFLFEGEGYSAKGLVEGRPDLSVGDNFISNEHIVVRFNKEGYIESYVDRATGKELSAGGLNRLVAYKDKKLYYNAWDIDENYIKYPQKLTLVSFNTKICGSRAVAETVYKYGKSTITQLISISGDRLVTVKNEIDWAESHRMLRAEFLPTIYSDYAECDIQFGAINRSTKEDTSVEQQQFEVCAHKYLSVSDEQGVFCVMSDSKYGYRAKNGLVSLNLLRSPKYPDPDCDMGRLSFNYAFGLFDSREETVAAAYNFNYPLVVTDKNIRIDPIASFDDPSIIIETIKPCYDNNGIAVRAYERYGQKKTVRFTSTVPHEKILSVDMLERGEEKADEELTILPHKIYTFAIKR